MSQTVPESLVPNVELSAENFEDTQISLEQCLDESIEADHTAVNKAIEKAGDRLSQATHIIGRFFRKALPYGAVVAAAVGGGDALAPAAAGANGFRQAQCTRYDESALSVSQAGQAVQPLANVVINDYHHTRSSDLRRKSNVSEMYGNSYKHVTEISATIPAKLKSGQPGFYQYVADFEGPVNSKDMVALTVSTSKGSNPNTSATIFDYELLKTSVRFSGSAPASYWGLLQAYAQGVSTKEWFDSKLADDSELGNMYSMTAPILTKSIHQAAYVLKQAIANKPIALQQNLLASEKPTQICSQ